MHFRKLYWNKNQLKFLFSQLLVVPQKVIWRPLTFSWRRPLSYRNQFLYKTGFYITASVMKGLRPSWNHLRHRKEGWKLKLKFAFPLRSWLGRGGLFTRRISSSTSRNDVTNAKQRNSNPSHRAMEIYWKIPYNCACYDLKDENILKVFNLISKFWVLYYLKLINISKAANTWNKFHKPLNWTEHFFPIAQFVRIFPFGIIHLEGSQKFSRN